MLKYNNNKETQILIINKLANLNEKIVIEIIINE